MRYLLAHSISLKHRNIKEMIAKMATWTRWAGMPIASQTTRASVGRSIQTSHRRRRSTPTSRSLLKIRSRYAKIINCISKWHSLIEPWPTGQQRCPRAASLALWAEYPISLQVGPCASSSREKMKISRIKKSSITRLIRASTRSTMLRTKATKYLPSWEVRALVPWAPRCQKEWRISTSLRVTQSQIQLIITAPASLLAQSPSSSLSLQLSCPNNSAPTMRWKMIKPIRKPLSRATSRTETARQVPHKSYNLHTKTSSSQTKKQTHSWK